MAVTEEARKARIDGLVDAHDPASEEVLRLPWRGDHRTFPVISLEIENTVLNPNSHRIQAQLESHPGAEEIAADPFSDRSQDAIAQILREDIEGFDDLRTNLEEEGQNAPGVVTQVGLLVNANRRAVALDDIGERYIRVAVLPESTDAEISDLELGLQMQIDFRQDYSFTNRLLFVDQLINRENRTVEEVARALNLAISSDEAALNRGIAKVEADTRVLSLLRQFQARSENQIPLTAFDAQEVAIEELERKYHEMRGEDPVGAVKLENLRLLGILTDVPYRDLRRFDPEAVDSHVLPILSDDDNFSDVIPALELAPEANGGEDPEGLDVIEEDGSPGVGEGASEGGAGKISALADLVARSYGQEQIELPTEAGSRVEDREQVVGNLNEALRGAASDIQSDQREENRLEAPARRVGEARRRLQSAAEAYERVKNQADFDVIAFEAALGTLRETLEELEENLRGVD